MKKIILLTLIVVFSLCTFVVASAEETDENAAMLISEAPEGFYDLGAEHYAFESAKSLYDKGYIEGDNQGRLFPDNSITREEAVKMSLAINKVDVEQGFTVSAPDYDEVSDWAKDDIATAYKYGIVRGDAEDGAIRPQDSITRAELVTVAMRTLNVQISDVSLDFADVKESDWYYSYLGVASELGIITKYDDGTFKPEQPITRADSFVIFDRVLTLRTALENAITQ